MNHLLAGRMGQRWRAEDIASLWFPFVTNKSFAFRKKVQITLQLTDLQLGVEGAVQ